jgi:drug/metabolite transporter (DMT)-like permease
VLPHLLLLSAVVLWVWTFVATKILVEGLGRIVMLAFRLALGLPGLGLVLRVRRVPLRFAREDARPLLLGGLAFTIHFLVQVLGLTMTTAVNTGWIIAVTPLALAVLSYWFLREQIGRGAVGGIVLATAGIVLLVSRGRVTDLAWLRSTGDWLVLGSAFTWAVYTVVTRDLVRRRSPLASVFVILAVSAVLAAVLLVTIGDPGAIGGLSRRGVGALLYLGVAGMAAGQWFWQEGVSRLGATRAGLYLYVEPLATLALAVPLLGEPFGPFIALGGALVLAGVYAGQRAPGATRGSR